MKEEDKYITMREVYDTLMKRKYDNLVSIPDSDGMNYIVRTVSTQTGIPRFDKVAAYAALDDLAEYYNDGWIPNWEDVNEFKFCIYTEQKTKPFYHVHADNWKNFRMIYFKRRKDALEVINNPNFRSILDVLFDNYFG